MAFADNLNTLPSVAHLSAIELLDAAGSVVARVENKPGQAGSLKVYAALAAKHGAKAAETVAIRSREAAGGVVSYAETNGFDHIVMGTGDKRGMSRLILGSVAGEVAGRAHCSVTVAR